MNAEQEIFNAYKQVLSEKTNKQDLPGVNIKGDGGYNNSKAADLEDQGGPGNVEGVQKPEEVDLSQKSSNYNKMQKISKKSKKVCESAINKNMNKTKSSFDKLFEDAMSDNSDLEDLGIENSTEAGDDTGDSVDFNVGGGGDGDEVTVTLDRATAQALHDVLMTALGGGDESDDMEGDDMEGDDMEDEDEDVMPEATEMEELPKHAGHHLTDPKKNNVGDEKVKPAGGKANSGKIPAVDTGSALHKHKQGAQKVEGSHLKTGASFFKS